MIKITDKNRTMYIIAMASFSATIQFLFLATSGKGGSILSTSLFCFALGIIIPIVFLAKNIKQALASLTAICMPIPIFTFALLLLVLFLEAYKKGLTQAFTVNTMKTLTSGVFFPFMVLVSLVLPAFVAAVAIKYAFQFVRNTFQNKKN